jgi:putative IMPACT (imprinted ancient) family translation regulator
VREVDAFRTLAGPAEAELRERGSRFLARAVPVTSRAGAEAFADDQARRHRDATHVVPAFVLHDGTRYASDAGEPAGSAGPPMLQVIDGARLADVAAVVIRWYGGVKLGVGGLVRAYGGVLATALATADVREAIPAVRLTVRYPHDQTSAVTRVLGRYGVREVSYDYAGDARTTFLVAAEREDRLAADLRDATRGAVAPDRLGTGVILQ